MLLDLWPYIVRDFEWVCAALIGKGWQREGENILWKRIRGKEYFITLVPQILYFHFNERQRAIPWIAVKTFSDPDNPLPRFVLQEIIEDLYYSGLKPFYDEDAWKKFFRRGKTRFGEDVFACYVNPDFPKGYWENHTL